jgi:hypothetical protein
VDGKICARNDALITLAQMDARRAQVVELRFLGGLSVDERRSVKRFTTDCDARLEAGRRVAGKRASLWSISGRSVTSRKLWDAVVVIDI